LKYPEKEEAMQESDRPKTEFELDLDALVPVPKGYVTVGKKRYAVYSLLDVDQDTALEILAEEARPRDERRLANDVEMMRRQLCGLAPELPTEAVQKLSIRKLIALYTQALSVAAPPEQDGGAKNPTVTEAVSTDRGSRSSVAFTAGRSVS
jgi:hypothetical protein